MTGAWGFLALASLPLYRLFGSHDEKFRCPATSLQQLAHCLVPPRWSLVCAVLGRAAPLSPALQPALDTATRGRRLPWQPLHPWPAPAPARRGPQEDTPPALVTSAATAACSACPHPSPRLQVPQTSTVPRDALGIAILPASWLRCICMRVHVGVWVQTYTHTYTYIYFFTVYLKLKSNWASCIISGKPTSNSLSPTRTIMLSS